MSTMKTIEEDTPLIPSIIAENVVAEAGDLIHHLNPSDPPERRLVERAERHYAQRGQFHRKIRGRNGREHLHAFMRHWLLAMLLDAGCPRDLIPEAWANGAPRTPASPE